MDRYDVIQHHLQAALDAFLGSEWPRGAYEIWQTHSVAFPPRPLLMTSGTGPLESTSVAASMMDHSSMNTWEKALSFYDTLSGPGWAHMPGFRALVSALARSEEARGLTAITSHEVLTISPYTRYPDWFEGRRIQLHPRADGTVHIVKYSERAKDTWTLPVAHARAKVLELVPDL